LSLFSGKVVLDGTTVVGHHAENHHKELELVKKYIKHHNEEQQHRAAKKDAKVELMNKVSQYFKIAVSVYFYVPSSYSLISIPAFFDFFMSANQLRRRQSFLSVYQRQRHASLVSSHE
jgi:hypothetical protein